MSKKTPTDNKNGNTVNLLLSVSATFNIKTGDGIIPITGSIIKAFDGSIYGIYETTEIDRLRNRKPKKVFSLTCLHTGYSIQRFYSMKEALNCNYIGFRKDSKDYMAVKKKMKPINDVGHYR